jgi:endonuclease/exonuclease/phosphatase family metal-dependent hydrolase
MKEIPMRIAAFNVENLFDRARIMNLDDWDAGKPVLDAFAEFTDLLERPAYSQADRARMIELMTVLDLVGDDDGRFVILRRNRGALVRRGAAGPEIIADGRGDWIGWAELKTEPVNATAVQNTARVIRDVGADILAVVEAEDRTALRKFNEDVLPVVQGAPYANVMVIDGNDDRGIDVGIMTRAGYDIGLMRSHVHDGTATSRIFSRDCPEYAVSTPQGETVWVLVNHLKSKGYGTPRESDARRRRQAEAVAGYYARLRSEGHDNVVVLGDMNDTPASWPLAPLYATDLREVSDFAGFDTGAFAGRGTYGLGNDSNKIDHILLSPALFARITAAGLFRMGAWPGVRPRRWAVYPELQREIHAASDHHAIWVDIG